MQNFILHNIPIVYLFFYIFDSVEIDKTNVLTKVF